MLELQPWMTAAPALALALICMLAIGQLVRAAPLPKPAATAWVAVLAVAIGVRLWVLPALAAHEFDGHEAEYWDIFRGERPLSRGGTVLYPSMQWWWAMWGLVLPVSPEVPVLVSVGVALIGILTLGRAVADRFGERAGLVAAALVSLHPTHAAWSSSAYNVVVPLTLGCISLWALGGCGVAAPIGRARPLLATSAAALMVLTRLDSAPLLLLHVALALHDAWRGGLGVRGVLGRWWLPLGVGLGLGCAGVLPLVVPGGLPGEGERGLSLQLHLLWAAPYAELASAGAAWALALLAFSALRRRFIEASVALGSALVAHGTLAAFDDFADRHALLTVLPLALVCGAALAPHPQRAPAGGAIAALALALGLGQGLIDMRTQFYASEERFAETLVREAPWSQLPRWSWATGEPVDAAGCGWVAEGHRMPPPPIGPPPRSHFNLLDPDEAAQLRGSTGCLLWVADLQDWRWSSRGVRDRAQRVERLFHLKPRALLVEDPGSGYPWGVVIEVGPRRCCGPTGFALDVPPPVGWGATGPVLP